MKKSFCFSAILLVLSNLSLHAGKINTTAVLNEASIFRAGAVLTHTTTVNLQQGNNNILINGLSTSVDVNSIRVQCSGDVTLMSFAYSKDYRVVPNDTLIKKLQDSIINCRKQLSAIQLVLGTNCELEELLRANKSVAGSRNEIMMDEFTKLMDYYKIKSLELEKEKDSLNEEVQSINDAISSLILQIGIQIKMDNKVGGNLDLQTICPTAGSYTFTISYYTPLASWNPYYDFKVDTAAGRHITIAYKAKVKQTTGFDWENIKVRFLTFMPNLSKTASTFHEWILKPVSNYYSEFYGVDEKQNQIIPSTANLNGTITKLSHLNSLPAYIVNGTIVSESVFNGINGVFIKNIDVLTDSVGISMYGAAAINGAVVATLKNNVTDYILEKESVMDTIYTFETATTIPDDGGMQLLLLREIHLPVTYKYSAAPKVEKPVFLTAEISGFEKYYLLPGEANLIVQGMNLGKFEINPVATQHTLNLIFNEDKQITATREIVKKDSYSKDYKTYKKQELTYQITITNTKNIPINMVVKDQFPLSVSADIEVKVQKTSGAKMDERTGGLTWMFSLNPGKNKILTIKYSVKYPKDEMLNLE